MAAMKIANAADPLLRPGYGRPNGENRGPAPEIRFFFAWDVASGYFSAWIKFTSVAEILVRCAAAGRCFEP